MKIIKRNGAEVIFNIDKIMMAVTKANEAVEETVRMTPLQIQRISQSVAIACEEMGRSPSVEEIQDLVEKAIIIFSILKTTSAPFLLIIFIGVSSLDLNNLMIFCV